MPSQSKYGEIYQRLSVLMQEMPSLTDTPPEQLLPWLGRAYALINQTGDSLEIASFKVAMDTMARENQIYEYNRAASEASACLYRVVAMAELAAPTEVQGSFIAAGNAFDAMVAIGKVMGLASKDLLIVDPYLDEKVLTDFALQAQDKVSIRLLGDKQSVNASLTPAIARWRTQYPSRPVIAKLAPKRSLHDRLIMIDGETAYIVTQSLKDLATRAPASIIRADAELARLKIEAYAETWDDASEL
jgi:hypothetical protein